MDQVHVIRHKVLVEGRSQRQIAKEFGISRLTVRKYVEEAVPIRKEAAPRARPVWDKVGARVDGAAGRISAVDRREAAADGDAAARVAGRREPSGRASRSSKRRSPSGSGSGGRYSCR